MRTVRIIRTRELNGLEIRNVRMFAHSVSFAHLMKYQLKRDDLLFPGLSFKLNGVLFDVSKQLGGGHREQYYQKAVAIALEQAKIPFREQVYAPLVYNGKVIGKYYLDFLVDEKIILELKRGQFVPATVINQTKEYLSALQRDLAIIACFTYSGVVIKRIINPGTVPRS